MKFDEKFDMIVGDCATTVVPYADLDTVLQNIASCLKPQGIAVQRIWVRYRKQTYPLSYIHRLLKKKPVHVHWYTSLLFPVFLHYYDTQNERLSGEDLCKKMETDFNLGHVEKSLLDLFSLVKNHKTPNNMLLKDDFEQLLGKHFTITKREYTKAQFSRNAPIYVLRRK
jgi:spermidine synthase